MRTGQMVDWALWWAYVGGLAGVMLLGTVTVVAVVRTLRLCRQSDQRARQRIGR
jgi:hypothetical protein